MSEITHIEKYHLNEFGDEEDSICVTECGQRATLFAEGGTDPEGFDFYLQKNAHQSTCLFCLQAYIKRLKEIA